MFPRWLSWLVLIVLGYLLIAGHRHHRQETAQPVIPAETVSPILATAPPTPQLDAATDLERWKRAINPTYAELSQCDFKPAAPDKLGLTITSDSRGEGDGAKCTDSITVKLTVWSNRGAAFYSGEVPLALGSRQVAIGLDTALIGIRMGETRTIILPPEALARAKKTNAPAALLHSLKPDIIAVVTATRVK